MGHRNAVKPAAFLMAVAAFAQEPAGLLEKARDKVLAEAAGLPNYVCTETIERSFSSRPAPPENLPSCERILVDRKNGRYHLRLDAAERLRVSVSIHQGREIYSWTGTAPYDHGVEDILQGGPVGTGVFAAHLLDVFSNSSVLFRFLGERPGILEYGFRMPVDGSRFVVAANSQWLPTGYSGSLSIDTEALIVRRLDIETNELPRETAMCQETTTMEFAHRQAAGVSWFLPDKTSTHDILRDATETDRVTSLSDCHVASSAPPSLPPTRTGVSLPSGLIVKLALEAPIDTDIAAAGDPISAIVSDDVITGRKGEDAVLPRGAIVRGRIIRMRRQVHPEPRFLIAIAFETVEANGALSPFYARLIDPPPATQKVISETMMLTGHRLEDWPNGIFGFPLRPHLVIPASFESKWRTSAPGMPDTGK